jgi:hypothetical protein
MFLNSKLNRVMSLVLLLSVCAAGAMENGELSRSLLESGEQGTDMACMVAGSYSDIEEGGIPAQGMPQATRKSLWGTLKDSVCGAAKKRCVSEIGLLSVETGLVAVLSLYALHSGNDSVPVWSSILAKMAADFVAERRFCTKMIPASLLAAANTLLFQTSQSGEWTREFATNMYWALASFAGGAIHNDFSVLTNRKVDLKNSGDHTNS